MIKEFFKKSIVSATLTAIISMNSQAYAADLDMINNISSSITRNNSSEFMALLPAGVQTQQIYALTTGRPYIFAVNYPDEAVTMIYLMSSSQDFKTGQINMNVKRISPKDAADKWMATPRKSVLFGNPGSPKDPFSQFLGTSNRLLGDIEDSKDKKVKLQSQNWDKANSYSLPAILGQLSLIYNAQQASFVVLQTWTDVKQWEEGNWLKKDFYAKNSTWVKPLVYTSELTENLGSRGAFSSYKIDNCTGSCTVYSPLKFIKSSEDGELQSRFMEAFTSSDLHLGGGWNSLIVAAFAIVTGCFACAVAYIAGSALNGNSITNTYISTNDVIGGIVSSHVGGPLGALAGGMAFTDEITGGTVDGATLSTVTGIGGSLNNTQTTAPIGTMIDRASLDQIGTTLGLITQEGLQQQQQQAKLLSGAYKQIKTSIEQASTTNESGTTSALKENRYEIASHNPTPVYDIRDKYIIPYAFTENGNTIKSTFYNPWVNQANQKFANQSSQEAMNDVKLLRAVGQEKGAMLQIGGNAYMSALRQSQTYDGNQQLCIPSANAPC